MKKILPNQADFSMRISLLHFKSPLIYFRWFPLVFNSNIDDVNDLTNDAKISFAKNGFNYQAAQDLLIDCSRRRA